MLRTIAIACSMVALTGCATPDMITTANTLRAVNSITADSVRAELITGLHYAR